MKPKLLVIDLDGTSLGGGYFPYTRFPDHFSAFLDALSGDGCAWATNTTWGGEGQWDLIRASSVKSRPVFLSAEMSLRLWSVEGECLKPLSKYNEQSESDLEKARPDMLRLLRDCISFTAETVNFHGHFLSFRCKPEEEMAFTDFQRSIDWKARKLIRYSSGPCSLAAIPDFLGKGKSLAEMARLLNLRPGEIVVAGDEEADIAMMEPSLSAFALCPSNASESVKGHVLSMGGIVSEKSNCDGVIDAFMCLAKQEGWRIPSP